MLMSHILFRILTANAFTGKIPQKICCHEILLFHSLANAFLSFMIIPLILHFYWLINDVQDQQRDWGQEVCLPLSCQTSSVGQQQISVSRLSTVPFSRVSFSLQKSFLAVFFCFYSFVLIFIGIYSISNIWILRSQLSA